MSAKGKMPLNPNLNIDYSKATLKEIYLAGGCFWGVEAYMRRLPGVARTSVGYANGKTSNPTYEEVCYSNTGHAEAVHILYDPERLPLEVLLDDFFKIIDPTTFNRQGNDVGSQYRSGIYYTDENDKQLILDFVDKIRPQYNKKIITEIKKLKNYFLAEEYHQSYLEKNPDGYCHISF